MSPFTKESFKSVDDSAVISVANHVIFAISIILTKLVIGGKTPPTLVNESPPESHDDSAGICRESRHIRK
ncbi:hypothetical protein JTE90_023579 [Oedothorax gibbosus]|uniref:Uncharacterized protein n=1 Tax=Oedothorax gibbosus TaxID=931172 RepID=A0AAV6TNV6_9ARAC|nr:hypothetical protein JTE90_023579 [Oedothorax gibbosus]